MTNSAAAWAPDFSHLYIESGAAQPPLTARIREEFPDATVVWIDNYQHLFGRPRQSHHLQRRSRKLILARKPDDFLYPGADPCQDFGQPGFVYTTPVLNCRYDCEYCYLQGLYPSANLVVFINLDDFFAATRQAVQQRPDPSRPLPLYLSYETDLLALERYLGLCRQWLRFAAATDGLLMEIRTKSAAFQTIADIAPTPRAILAWTLSPDLVVASYEHGTPPLRARLRAARQALDAGWQVRLCFDPILPIDNWPTVYAAFFERVFRELPGGRIHDAAMGVFRMGKTCFNRIRKQRRDAAIYFDQRLVPGDLVSYQPELRAELLNRLQQQLEVHLAAEHIHCL